MVTSAATTARQLAHVSEHPDRAAVIYDGECRFCVAQVQRLSRWDWRERLAFISLHDPDVARRWPALQHDDLMQQMYVVTPDGHTWRGAAAVRYLTRVLPPLWPAAIVFHLPGSLPLWQWAYRLVARWRYRIAGRAACDGGTCELHYAALAERRDQEVDR